MQYYYECLDIYEKLIPEVKNHCGALQKLERQYTVMKDAILRAAEEVQAEGGNLSSRDLAANKAVVTESANVLFDLASEKRDVGRSLIITVDFYLSRLYGYLREFSCEADCETPGTSAETDRIFFPERLERLKVSLRRLNNLRDEYSIFDELLSLPPVDSLQPSESTSSADPVSSESATDYFKDAKLNGHRQNIVHTYQFIQDSFRDEEAPLRSRASTTGSVKRQGQLRIKTERRGSLAGSPSPRSLSPRTSKFRMDQNFFQPSPSFSGTNSPMDMSPMPSNQNAFNYDSPSVSGFSAMPSFLSSHESRHGRQRKFTPKAQQMFKDKGALGRPSHYPGGGSSSHPNLAGSSGMNLYSGGPPSAGIVSSSQGLPPVASSSYSFPQDFNRLPTPNQHHQQQPPPQQQQQNQIMGPPKTPQQSGPSSATPNQRPFQLNVGPSGPSSMPGPPGPMVSRPPSSTALLQQQQQQQQPGPPAYGNHADMARQRQDSQSGMQVNFIQQRPMTQPMLPSMQQPRPPPSPLGMKPPPGGGNGIKMPHRPPPGKPVPPAMPSPTLVRFPSKMTTNGGGQLPPSNRDSSPNVIEEEDERPWCFCGDRSYGEMVECSNPKCHYVWFHFQCVGITQKPVGNWLCQQCRRSSGEGIVEV